MGDGLAQGSTNSSGLRSIFIQIEIGFEIEQARVRGGETIRGDI